MEMIKYAKGYGLVPLLLTVVAGCNCLTCSNNSESAPRGAVTFEVGQNGWSIWTVQDFKNPVQLTTGPFDDSPCWGPGKRQIFFDRSYPGSPEIRIWKMKWNGQDQTAMTPHGMICEAASPSPDGTHVAFMCKESYYNGSVTRYDICMVDVSGENWTVLTDSLDFPPNVFYHFGRPTWSPDGSRLGIYFNRHDQSNVFSLGVLEINMHRLLTFPQLDSMNPEDCSWSPTRSEMIFLGDNLRVCRVNADGSGFKVLVEPYNYGLDWSPDGNQIIYDHVDSAAGLGPVESSFWVMNRDGTNKHMVMPYNGLDISNPSWK